MSSLWTPGGEVPVGRDRAEGGAVPPSDATEPSGTGGDASAAGGADEAAIREQMAEMQRQLLAMPAAEVIGQHAVALYELAALHVSQPIPRPAEARLAVDGLEALLEGLADRLGPVEAALREVLPQLKMAVVEAGDRARTESAGSEPSAE